MTPLHYVGLISGTSVDSIDAALVRIEDHRIELIHALSYAIEPELQQLILELCHADQVRLDLIGTCDRMLGEHFGAAAQEVIASGGVAPDAIRAIGSHGQTIRHRPDVEGGGPFTMQIGDPNIIAFTTGVDTVADFRRMDMAASGQAAPLAPIFHRALFGASDHDRTLCNIGGISNVTWLPSSGEILGFDLGAGNALLDGWIGRHKNLRFDRDGLWAASGQVQQDLLAAMLQHPYLALPPPKSTGREDFNLSWLDSVLGKLGHGVAAEDVQATLLEFTAQTIASGIRTDYLGRELFVCGGGAHNKQLMQRLAELLSPVPVSSTLDLGIAPDWVEACGFAWLAHQRLEFQPGNHPAVTGARALRVLGGLYCGKPVL